MAYNLNKALSSYLDMNRDRVNLGKEEEVPEKKVYPKVDIKQAMADIESSVKRVDSFVKRDLDKIAELDIKMRSI